MSYCGVCYYNEKKLNPCMDCSCGSEKKENQTNADLIRSMSDEELAEFLHDYINHTCSYCKECKSSCTKQNLEWLQSEAE